VASESKKDIDMAVPLDSAAPRVRVGVIGCGLIAQVMHLHYLTVLRDRFELVALCDLSEEVVAACGERYGVKQRFTDWQDLLACPLDAVLVLTSGNHAAICQRAAAAGIHVFVEKPMAFSSSEGATMVRAAADAGVQLMVGTMKRYDPTFEVLRAELSELDALRLVVVTTLEARSEPYVEHHRILRPSLPLPPRSEHEHEVEARSLELALGDVDERTRWCYRHILLDNLVHELNLLRGVLGEPTRVEYADLTPQSVVIVLQFGDVRCQLAWADVPGVTRYRQELAFYASDGRVTLTFPSPYLRNMPTSLVIVGGEADTAHTWERRDIVSYDEAFERELIAFHECIATGREPRTAGRDALLDLMLCEAIARVHEEGAGMAHLASSAPVPDPIARGR